MVRDALNLPEETELEKAHRAKAAANLAAIKDAEDEEE